MYIFDFIITVIFVILGIIFYMDKGSFLIAGYNTMKSEKKSKVDEKALCRFMSKAMFVFAFSTFLWSLSNIVNKPILHTTGIIIFFITALFNIIYSNTKNRFIK
jgi:hypothetical protein